MLARIDSNLLLLYSVMAIVLCYLCCLIGIFLKGLLLAEAKLGFWCSSSPLHLLTFHTSHLSFYLSWLSPFCQYPQDLVLLELVLQEQQQSQPLLQLLVAVSPLPERLSLENSHPKIGLLKRWYSLEVMDPVDHFTPNRRHYIDWTLVWRL